jgi:hypothetical protein
MNELHQTPERHRNSLFLFFEQMPGARSAAIPPRLIVGFDFMEHGLAKLSKGPKHSPPSCMLSACPRLIS